MGFFAGAACQDAGDTALRHVADSAGVQIVTIGALPADLDTWRLAAAPEFVVTGAEAGDSSVFAQVSAVQWLPSGRFVVGDVMASRLLVFDSTGQFLRAFGRRGDGPGEFRQLGSITALASDTIVTYDVALLRFSVWHPDRGFVRSTQLRSEDSVGSGIVNAWPWRASESVALHVSATPRDAVRPGSELRRWPMRARLTLHDALGEVVETSPSFDGIYTLLNAGGDAHAPFSHRPFVAVTSDRIYFGSGASYALSYLNAGFDRAGELRWPGRHESLTADEVQQVKEWIYAALPAGYPAERRRARVDPGLAPGILPEDRPAIGRVLVAADGRLWVERFVATHPASPLPPVSDRWSVLEAGGDPVALVRLPPGVRLEAIRGNRAAVVIRDEFDVQQIAVYRLTGQ